MNGLNYLLQSNLYLIIFYGFYWVLLRKETFNNFNRAYLVISGLVSFAIPLWNLEMVQNWFITQKTTEVILQMSMPEYVFSNAKVENSFDITNYLSIVYGFGCIVLAAKLIMNIFNLYRYMYGITPISKAFSFFNNIFIAEGLDPDDVIYDHERVHASQYHSFDVLLFEIIGIFCWFNPVIYLYKIAVKNIHEFIADEIASSKLPSKLDYAMLLFSEKFQTHPSVLVSNFFNKTSLKLRIEMLNKKRSNKVAVLKYGLIFPVFLGMLIFTSAAIARGEKFSELLSFNKTIEGTVLNYDYKPIVGATVLIANTEKGTKTDKNGMFKLQTNQSKTELVFSHVSYLTKQLNVISTESIKVTMRRQTKELQGTVVLENQNENFYKIQREKNLVKIPKTDISANNDYVIVEKNAEYIGGTSELYEYLKSNLRYPKEARDNRKHGVVYTKFMVNEKGEISNVKIVNPLGYIGFIGFGLETEAKRVVANMPKWIPAIQNGEAVSSDFTIPIQFILDEKENIGEIADIINKYPKSVVKVYKDGIIQENIDINNLTDREVDIINIKQNKTVIPQTTIIEIHLIGKISKKVDSKSTIKYEKGQTYFINDQVSDEKEVKALLPENVNTVNILKDDKINVVKITLKNNTTLSLQEEEIFTEVEKNAEFPGGHGAMGKYLAMNMKYPAPAQRANVQGKVFLSFVVRRNGDITDVQILKGLGFGMDEEAIRVVKAMPKWIPAMVAGRNVNSKFNLPISFMLSGIK